MIATDRCMFNHTGESPEALYMAHDTINDLTLPACVTHGREIVIGGGTVGPLPAVKTDGEPDQGSI